MGFLDKAKKKVDDIGDEISDAVYKSSPETTLLKEILDELKAIKEILEKN